MDDLRLVCRLANHRPPNYQFAGLKWYQFLVSRPRFEVDIRNNLMWLLLGVDV